MRLPRKGIVWLLLLACFAAPALSGCSSSEPTVAYGVVESGMAGTLFNGVKHELDVADQQEAEEAEPHSPAEREEDHEALEQREAEAHTETAPPQSEEAQ
jgi:hypothetical protein